MKYDKEWQTSLCESRLSIAGGERITSAFVNDEIAFYTWEFEGKSVTEAATDLQLILRSNQTIESKLICSVLLESGIALSSVLNTYAYHFFYEKETKTYYAHNLYHNILMSEYKYVLDE